MILVKKELIEILMFLIQMVQAPNTGTSPTAANWTMHMTLLGKMREMVNISLVMTDIAVIMMNHSI